MVPLEISFTCNRCNSQTTMPVRDNNLKDKIYYCSICRKRVDPYSGDSYGEDILTYINSQVIGGTHNSPITLYAFNCNKGTGTKKYSRNVDTYKCNTCGASTTYYNAATVNGCTICRGSHNVSASGSKTTSHKAVSKYLICGK